MNLHPYKGTQFKRGQSGNPGGFKKGEVAKKTLKHFTKAEIAIVFNKLMNYSTEDLGQFLKLKTAPIVEQIVARALYSDVLRGELLNTEKILDRIIGKTKPELIDNLPPTPAIHFIF